MIPKPQVGNALFKILLSAKKKIKELWKKLESKLIQHI